MVLKDLENVPDYNKTDYERIAGEGRVMRAYLLLRLNQLFAPYDKMSMEFRLILMQMSYKEEKDGNRQICIKR